MRHASHQRGSRGVFSSFSGVCALAATVFVGPLLWPLVDAPITVILRDLYSYQTAQYLAWSMEIASYPIAYFALRAGLEAALTYLNVLVIKRFV